MVYSSTRAIYFPQKDTYGLCGLQRNWRDTVCNCVKTRRAHGDLCFSLLTTVSVSLFCISLETVEMCLAMGFIDVHGSQSRDRLEARIAGLEVCLFSRLKVRNAGGGGGKGVNPQWNVPRVHSFGGSTRLALKWHPAYRCLFQQASCQRKINQSQPETGYCSVGPNVAETFVSKEGTPDFLLVLSCFVKIEDDMAIVLFRRPTLKGAPSIQHGSNLPKFSGAQGASPTN